MSLLTEPCSWYTQWSHIAAGCFVGQGSVRRWCTSANLRGNTSWRLWLAVAMPITALPSALKPHVASPCSLTMRATVVIGFSGCLLSTAIAAVFCAEARKPEAGSSSMAIAAAAVVVAVSSLCTDVSDVFKYSYTPPLVRCSRRRSYFPTHRAYKPPRSEYQIMRIALISTTLHHPAPPCTRYTPTKDWRPLMHTARINLNFPPAARYTPRPSASYFAVEISAF